MTGVCERYLLSGSILLGVSQLLFAVSKPASRAPFAQACMSLLPIESSWLALVNLTSQANTAVHICEQWQDLPIKLLAPMYKSRIGKLCLSIAAADLAHNSDIRSASAPPV